MLCELGDSSLRSHVASADVRCRRSEPGDSTANKLIAEVARFTPPGHTRDRLLRASAIELAANPSGVGAELGTGLDVAAYDTAPFCVWIAARHLDSYEEALWAATSQHGDRDTMGAIVGGIVVLATGEQQIPVLWRSAAEPVSDPLS